MLPKIVKCTVYSKRDVNADVNMPLSSKSTISNKVASGEKNKIETKADRCKKKRTAADLEMGFSSFIGQINEESNLAVKKEIKSKVARNPLNNHRNPPNVQM